MLARHAVLLTPSRSSRPPQLLSRQQLARPSNSFSCNTYKKRGGGGLIVNQKSDEGFLSRADIGRVGPLLPSDEGFLSRATIGREGPLLAIRRRISVPRSAATRYLSCVATSIAIPSEQA